MEIVTYSEEFLPTQVEIGKNATSNWKYFNQTSLERLKQKYSALDFDPSTKLYLKDKGEIVGFQTANILSQGLLELQIEKKANLAVPLVYPANRSFQQTLMKHSLDNLKKMGVTEVEMLAGKAWPGSLDLVKKFGFEEVRSVVSFADIDLEYFNINVFEEMDENVHEFDLIQDGMDLAQIFHQLYNRPVQKLIDQYRKLGERTISHKIIRKDGKIIARAVITKDPDNDQRGIMGTPYLESTLTDEEKEKCSEQLLYGLLSASKAQGYKIISVRDFFGTSVLQKFEKQNFPFNSHLSVYATKIEN